MMSKGIRTTAAMAALFSFCVQATGAADMAMMMGPAAFAGRGLLPPPQRIPAAFPPAPPFKLPSISPYFKGLPESAAVVADWVGSRVRSLSEAVANAGVEAMQVFVDAAVMDRPAPVEPPQGGTGFATREPEAPSEAPAMDRILTQSQAPAAMTPPPAEFALPAPEPAAEPAPIAEPAPVPPPAEEEGLVMQKSALREMPQPVNDKSHLFRFPHLQGTSWLKPLHGGASLLSRFEARWVSGGAVRFKVTYLNPVGVSHADQHGLTYNELGRVIQNPDEILPEQYWGTFALYHHGQEVRYALTIENTSGKTLNDLTVTAAEEVFNRKGGPGERLPADVKEIKIKSLAPGESVRVLNSFMITSDWAYHGSLEQTHVRVEGRKGARGAAEVLGEDYQAGLIDPPPED